MMNVFGGVDTKKYIIETTGTGVAIFDYDNDGWPDIFIVNGTTLEGFSSSKAPTNHLYHNNHDGTFTDVTARTGLAATGWGQGGIMGVLVGSVVDALDRLAGRNVSSLHRHGINLDGVRILQRLHFLECGRGRFHDALSHDRKRGNEDQKYKRAKRHMYLHQTCEKRSWD